MAGGQGLAPAHLLSGAMSEQSGLSEVEADLDAVEASLERLDADQYGRCEVCGEAIESAALEADPTAGRCRQHEH